MTCLWFGNIFVRWIGEILSFKYQYIEFYIIALYHKLHCSCGSLRNYFFRKISPYLAMTIQKEWENASGG